MLTHRIHTKGFTLIEVMVSTALFSIVMVVALGALLSLSAASRKAQTLNTAVNNMSAALESMSRTIRTGYGYNCSSGSTIVGSVIQVNNCSSDAQLFSFVAADQSHVEYCLHNGVVGREVFAGPSGSWPAGHHDCSTDLSFSTYFTPLTPPDVSISKLTFYVVGANPKSGTTPDSLQPKVTILMAGTVAVTANQSTAFNIQTTVTQRIYDQ